MKKVVFRVVIYFIIIAVVAAITFAPTVGKEDPDIAYYIFGGIALAGWLAFVIANEIIIKKKSISNK